MKKSPTDDIFFEQVQQLTGIASLTIEEAGQYRDSIKDKKLRDKATELIAQLGEELYDG